MSDRTALDEAADAVVREYDKTHLTHDVAYEDVASAIDQLRLVRLGRDHPGLLPKYREALARPPEGLDALMRAYFAARNSDIPVITTGKKALEEAQELVDAILDVKVTGETVRVHEELADLALVAAVVAAQYGTTVEAAIVAKTRHDAGRGEPKQDPRAALDAPSEGEPCDHGRSAHGPTGCRHCDCRVTYDGDRDSGPLTQENAAARGALHAGNPSALARDIEDRTPK